MTPKKEEIKPVEDKKTKLASETLGEITKTKKKGPTTVLVMMVILIAFAILLPNIADFIKNINLRSIEESLLTKKDAKKEEVIPEEEKVIVADTTYYDFLEETSIVSDNVTYTGFKVTTDSDTYLEFNATNNKADTYNLGTKNLYFELYDDTKTLLERVKLASYASLEKGTPETFTLLINQGLNISQIRLITYDTDDYPAIELTADAEGNSELICTNLQSKMTYSFTNSSLVSITETFTYTNADLETYAEVLTLYKAKQEKLDAESGITATLVESGVNFSYNAITDLSVASITNLNDHTYFAKNTVPKVINFEMEAMRYNCE